jgi:hypothetical protein
MMNLIRRIVAGAFIVCLPSFSEAGETARVPRFEPPPRLATTAGEWAILQKAGDFETRKSAAIKAAEDLLSKPVELPNGYGSWIFYYANPENGRKLVPISLLEHEDPTTGKIFTDSRTVAAYRTVLHYAAEAASRQLGWAYLYTGDDRYAAEVKRILIKFAQDYSTYPGRIDRWGMRGPFARLGGRRYVQSLDEATGVIELAKAYDLTRTSPVYTEEDRSKIESDFFRATAQTLLRFNQDISNHQTWYNAGLMAIASVLADGALVERVLTMRGGYYDQLKRSVGAEGLWYEGTLAYHSYAVSAMIEIVKAGNRLGLSLHDEPKFKKLFTAPLRVVYPNGALPAINDSDPGNVQSFNGHWRWAWVQYRDPFFAQLLARGDEKVLRSLLEEAGITEGIEVMEWPPKVPSEDLPDAGLVALRMGSGDKAVCVFMDYGPHGGGHGHFDKLNLLLFANGREWLLDPGRLDYSHKEYSTWVKTTAAHNTVALGERSQQPTTGSLLHLQEGDGFVAAVAESKGAYPSSTLRRSLLLTPHFLVDVFDVQNGKADTIDLFAHANAASLEPIVSVPPESKRDKLGNAEGYQHLADASEYRIDGNSQWDYVSKGAKLRVHLLGEPAERLISCFGIGYAISEKTPTLLRRRHGSETRFVAVYDLSGNGTGITRVSREPSAEGDSAVLLIETPEQTYRITVGKEGVMSIR